SSFPPPNQAFFSSCCSSPPPSSSSSSLPSSFSTWTAAGSSTTAPNTPHRNSSCPPRAQSLQLPLSTPEHLCRPWPPERIATLGPRAYRDLGLGAYRDLGPPERIATLGSERIATLASERIATLGPRAPTARSITAWGGDRRSQPQGSVQANPQRAEGPAYSFRATNPQRPT